MNAEMCQLFVEAFAQAFPDRLNVLWLDNSGAYTSSQLTLPENVRLLLLPPYCPELNPIARVWRDLNDNLAWRQFADLDAQQHALHRLLQGDDAATLPSLTGYPSLVEAIHALHISRSHITPFAATNEILVLRNGSNDHQQRAARIRYKDILAGRYQENNILLKSGDTIMIP